MIEFSTSDLSSDAQSLLAELREIGELIVRKQPAKGRGTRGGSYRLELTTFADEATIRDLLAFVLAPDAVALTVLDAATQTSSDTGWGLFEPPSPDPGYGLFADADPDQADLREATSQTRVTPFSVSPPATPSAAAPRALGEARSGNGADGSSIRVGVDKVDQLINLVGELVITQAMLAQTSQGGQSALDQSMAQALAQLERNTRDLQEAVMSIRMLPIAFVFSRFPRMMRDLAAKLGKQVQLRTFGEATELDKGVIEKISDPLTHLVRNAVDHGIEPPAQRLAASKPAVGTITLRAFHQGGNIVVELHDDGAGLQRARILAKARERGLPVDDGMSDAEVWQLIFEPGFSTAVEVTDVSGRGVGMDVVRRNIAEMGGRVELDSDPGAGTTITIRLPLTLAILDGLSVRVRNELFIVPLNCIIESLQPSPGQVAAVAGSGRVVRVRGEYLPVISLSEVMNVPGDVDEAPRLLVLLESEGRRIALGVDELMGQHQVVIKSLETNYRKVWGLSGATIMGDGQVAPILDVPTLVHFESSQLGRAA
jgi:two-component system chemotaxis sensor kinase CheA